jgi:hypothetical protein
MRAYAPLAARHWSAPRPSFAEYGRRWRSGLCFGSGQALRAYLGRPGLEELLRRNAHYLGMLALWLAGPLAWVLGGGRLLALWSIAPLGLFAFMTVRKRSARLALHALLTWTIMAAGLVVGGLRGPGAAGDTAVGEVAC